MWWDWAFKYNTYYGRIIMYSITEEFMFILSGMIM